MDLLCIHVLLLYYSAQVCVIFFMLIDVRSWDEMRWDVVENLVDLVDFSSPKFKECIYNNNNNTNIYKQAAMHQNKNKKIKQSSNIVI